MKDRTCTMFSSVCLAVLAAATVTANVVHNGNCPEISAVANFNSTAYAGTWYEVSKYPNDAEKKGKCASVEYKVEKDTIKVKNVHVLDKVQTTIEGTAKLAPDANNTGKMLLSQKFGDKIKETALLILETDYTNYAVAYNCKYDEKNKSHQEYAWILSRNKKLEGAAKTAVDNFIKATKQLDATKFQQTDFSEEACKFDKSATITESTA